MEPFQIPYDININEEEGEINLKSSIEQDIDFETLEVFEGYPETTAWAVSDTVYEEIENNLKHDIKQLLPLYRVHTEIFTNQRLSVTTVLLLLFIGWFLFEFVVFPFVFATPIGSDLWLKVFIFSSENPHFIWTWITSIFGHGGFTHLLVNSIVLGSFGYMVEDELSWKPFVLLFFFGGLVSGIVQVSVVSLFTTETIRLIGASGGISAVLGCAAILYPNIKARLFFIIPIELSHGIIFFVAISLGLILSLGFGALGIGHTAHLTGLFFGIITGGIHKLYYYDSLRK